MTEPERSKQGKQAGQGKQGKRRLRWPTVVLTLLALLLLLVAYGWHLHRSVPEKWNEVDAIIGAMSDAELAERAQSIETLVVNESQGIDSTQGPNVKSGRPDEVTERRVVIPVKDANIWLATRLNQLLVNQNMRMPLWIRNPRVWIDDGELVLSGQLNTRKLKGVVSIYLNAQILDDGQLRLQATGARSGRLPVPTAIVENVLREKVSDSDDDNIKQLGDLFNGIVIDPVMRSWSDERRQIRLLDLDIFDDRVELFIRTSPARSPEIPTPTSRPGQSAE